jgi:recombination protein RecT
MTIEGAKRIISMVDICGGKEGKNNFVAIIKRSLPVHIKSVDNFAIMFENVVNSKLADPYITDKSSILPCVFQAVKFGLYPDPAMGQIYFVPYKNNATQKTVLTYQLGYRGMIQLMYNSGKIINVQAYRVFDNDFFEQYIDENGHHFKFRPVYNHEKAKEYIVCSFATMENGKCFANIMESDKVDEIKKVVLQRTPKSPWSNPLYEPEMRKKTVIRNHAKTLPCSIELQTAIVHEDLVERGDFKEIQEEILDSVMSNVDAGEAEEQGDILDNAQKEFTKQL